MCYCTHRNDRLDPTVAGNPTFFEATIEDHCFHQRTFTNGTLDPIHEHCCTGRHIDFRPCADNENVLTVGNVDFCKIFFGEGSFKNEVDKKGWVSK